MSLNKEWFEHRDQFINEQINLGHLSLQAVMEELDLTFLDLSDLNLLDSRDLSTASVNPTKLTRLGGLFFTEKYQSIFITQEKFTQLKLALENWENFTVEFQCGEPKNRGKISIKRRDDIRFRIDGNILKHSLRFRVCDSEQQDILSISDDSSFLTRIWEQFCDCVLLIENEDKSPTNSEISADQNAINTLCAPWHPIVQNYFKGAMHKLGFEDNFQQLKNKIAKAYSFFDYEWQSVREFYNSVGPVRASCEPLELDIPNMTVNYVTPKCVNEFSFTEPEEIQTSAYRMKEYIKLQPGDVLLFKTRDTKQVRVAFHSSELDECYTSRGFYVLRAKGGNNWDGKRLFTFLQSQIGKQILEHTFKYFSAIQKAFPIITPSQVSLLKLPVLSVEQSKVLDNRLAEVLSLMKQRKALTESIFFSLDAQYEVDPISK